MTKTPDGLEVFINRMFVSDDYTQRRNRHKVFPGEMVIKMDGATIDVFKTPENFNPEAYVSWFLKHLGHEELPKYRYERLFKIEQTAQVGENTYLFVLFFDVIELGRRRAKIVD